MSRDVPEATGVASLEGNQSFENFVAWINNQLARFSFPIILRQKVNDALSINNDILSGKSENGFLSIQVIGYYPPKNKAKLYAALIGILQGDKGFTSAEFTFDGDEIVGPDIIKVLKEYGFQGSFKSGNRRGTYALQIKRI